MSEWQSIFDVNKTSGVLTVLDFTKEIYNYQIYVKASNVFGTSGGDKEYLINLTLASGPKFLNELPESIIINNNSF